ncbi:serine/threonine protein kinase [Tundrisphaera sp. TA3]|uniref:serine/threonine protein kinase n=1 Tax=Tundrisphaera sp. TA3 TaxID=3435775 RepID=UPI003EB985D6
MIGQKLGSFQIESILGSGAMGVVYLGVHQEKNRKAAIKVIGGDQMGKGNAYERFVREAVILEQFRHPNIVRYLARGRASGINYYAMEFVEGQTVDHILTGRGTLHWREVVALGIQLCDALHYAHERGIVHRDLKPSNLMLTADGKLKLTDFGIAKDLDATALTATGRTLGTAAYMAPEQIRGNYAISHKTDLYSLGCVFYQLLTGEVPFVGQTPMVMMHAHINSPVPHPSSKTQEIPKALDALIVSLMAKEPSDRPWDAEAVAQTLRELQKKDQAKETVAMVWPEPGSDAANPTRAEVLADPRPAKTAKKRKQARPRVGWEVVGLVLGLVAVGSLIAYLLWPPGEAYLYRHARELMASAEPSDWVRARDEYLAPLDARFPKHAHREEVDGWLDRIDLHQVKRRAEVLERPVLLALTKPKTETEIQYRTTFDEAAAALAIHHDGDAYDLWKKLELSLAREGRKERGWALLAGERAEQIKRQIEQRREVVAGLLARATITEPVAATEAGRKYRKDILEDIIARFGPYPDVADLVDEAKVGLSALPAS